MPYSKAQKNATLKYRAKKGIVKMGVDMSEEQREKYKNQATKRGMSLSAYIINLIEKDMEGKQ